MEQHIGLDFRDYLAVLRRRRWHLILPMVLIILISIGAAFGLPSVYRSTATILIEQQEIPQELVSSTVTSYAAERIQVISQRVMTRDNLWTIVEKYNLFQQQRETMESWEIVAEMKNNIMVDMVYADVVDPRSTRAGKATIAFELSFESNAPLASQQVVKELVSLYLNENVRIRTEKAAITSDFLAEEAGRMSDQIEELEARLAEFKERNAGRLPELMQLNMSLMERTEREFEGTERQIASLNERKVYLESQLAQLETNTNDSPEGRLRILQAEYMRTSAIYSSEHPDITRLRREIDALKLQVGSQDDVADLKIRIQEVQGSLAVARERYSEEHPNVVDIKRSLAALTEALREAQQIQPQEQALKLRPNNPAYVSTRTQLEAIKITLGAELKKRARLKEKLALYEERLIQMPRVEQEVLSLKREYENAISKYHELKQKQLQAQVSEQLEKENKGERFSLLEPPILPTEPIKPNRVGILLLGTVLSMASGLGFASLSEFLDRTVRGSKALTSLLKAPPLAAIPYIRTEADFRHERRRAWLIKGIVLVVIVAILLGIHIFWMPLDILWSTGLANMGLQQVS